VLLSEHPRFRDLLKDMGSRDKKRVARRTLFAALRASGGAVLTAFADTFPDSPTAADLEEALPLVQASCALTADTIERFMGVIYNTIAPSWSAQGSDDPAAFRSVCTFAIALLTHPTVRPRFDPRERRYFEAVATYAGKHIDQKGGAEVAETAQEFFVSWCEKFGRSAVVRFLEESRTVTNLFLRCAIAPDVAVEFELLWAQSESSKSDVIMAVFRLLPPEGPLPDWARVVLGRINEGRLWHARVVRKFARAVIRRGTEDDARSIVAKLADVRSKEVYEWHVISNAFTQWPKCRELITERPSLYPDSYRRNKKWWKALCGTDEAE
jgi:hypothetical protein